MREIAEMFHRVFGKYPEIEHSTDLRDRHFYNIRYCENNLCYETNHIISQMEISPISFCIKNTKLEQTLAGGEFRSIPLLEEFITFAREMYNSEYEATAIHLKDIVEILGGDTVITPFGEFWHYGENGKIALVIWYPNTKISIRRKDGKVYAYLEYIPRHYLLRALKLSKQMLE